MITTDYVRAYFNAPGLSDAYVQKLIDYADGDIYKLDNLLVQKKLERETRNGIYDYEVNSNETVRLV
ncbi:hypothetical protein [Staphylococcus xylosus]|uniref:hypothetical protein n=1 Tax=Staphylococcus xylosus TaxID=1288 RepID=UPI002DB6A642|nr:hypothetical protein [Staphylococcus xylosus]MEB8060609.1 hypothetical protein [Staphylococcus xylosus]